MSKYVKEKILMLVKATPTPSKKYGYCQCTAGINDKGGWRRLYPFKVRRFRKGGIGFKKKQWIEVDVSLDTPKRDKRRESRKVKQETVRILRKESDPVIKGFLDKFVDKSINSMDVEKASLGIIKPIVKDIKIRVLSTDTKDPQTILSETRTHSKTELFKMPVEVRYMFMCGDKACSCNKKPHKICFIDSEINELFRNIRKNTRSKEKIIEKLRKKLFDELCKSKDLYFVMGTTTPYRSWVIIGLLYFKKGTGKQKTLVKLFN